MCQICAPLRMENFFSRARNCVAAEARISLQYGEARRRRTVYASRPERSAARTRRNHSQSRSRSSSSSRQKNCGSRPSSPRRHSPRRSGMSSTVREADTKKGNFVRHAGTLLHIGKNRAVHQCHPRVWRYHAGDRSARSESSPLWTRHRSTDEGRSPRPSWSSGRAMSQTE